ncbi:hypothetical protein HDV05_006007, partial [Chytridiales sp. JEL 0842]
MLIEARLLLCLLLAVSQATGQVGSKSRVNATIGLLFPYQYYDSDAAAPDAWSVQGTVVGMDSAAR